MRLTNYTSYALRVLQYAALHDPHLCRVHDVADAHGLSRAHVTKIVHELGQAGLLETVRGRGGGFRLGRPASQIRIGDVLRVTEGPLDLVECFNPDTNTCRLIGICGLSEKLTEATQAFLEVLDSVTVADISCNRGALMARLGRLVPASG
ncbi:MAG: Rrf2 family transcriptional regulator [Pseudomonadota bacterium]